SHIWVQVSSLILPMISRLLRTTRPLMTSKRPQTVDSFLEDHGNIQFSSTFVFHHPAEGWKRTAKPLHDLSI
ncbi:MAG: hypothetical protein KDA52_25480, partial [Planctomycetaceae bacterium]|nr:hypothetical protein [Planctomycetaceae bacterium]